jgi:hypothetical protein
MRKAPIRVHSISGPKPLLSSPLFRADPVDVLEILVEV